MLLHIVKVVLLKSNHEVNKMTTITNHVLRQQLKNIATGTSTKVQNIATSNTSTLEETEETEALEITTKKFQKIGDYGNTIIFSDNTTAKILQPMPCMRWTPKKTPDNKGVVTLSDQLEATVIKQGNKQYVLGYTGTFCGVCTELELLIDLGETEILMNNEFYSVKAPTHAKDGVRNE